ncbi:DUF3016 domain-containing protein [Aliidiomarina minuta]|uniref:DUF3016 domain-containing protein n=1 Tax=Aliidiomarina minuta TaxID=880057 RepID=A0A432W423_9GAMM|nr:DUF3016 domain-containing protein [Aliidiomarina minuta]RUO24105.1 DUF3016 domain-containing protein [Aliidiomarina minuta]
MRSKLLLGVMAGMLIYPFSALSAELDLTWENPESYTDLQEADEHRNRFRERTLNALESKFNQLAEWLPEDQVLVIKVTDVDLAGRVEPMRTGAGLQRVRVIRSLHQPRMSLEYQLQASDGSVLEEGTESLRGRGHMDHGRIIASQDREHVRFESEMIERWFRSTFADYLQD